MSRWRISFQGVLCPGDLYPGGSLSRGISVQVGDICPGGEYLSRWGISVQVEDICPGGGSVSRGSLSGWSLSRWSLSRGSLSSGVSVQGGPPGQRPPIR